MTRPNQDDVLGAIVTTLQEIVAPEMTTPYARARLHTAIYLLRRLRERGSNRFIDLNRRVDCAGTFLSLAAELYGPSSLPDSEGQATDYPPSAANRSPEEIERTEDALLRQVARIVDLVNDDLSRFPELEKRLQEFLLEYTSIDP